MMYYKIIDDKKVFSSCLSIKLEFDHPPFVAGQWVSKPDAQLIYDEGWREFVPPVIPELEPDLTSSMDATKKMFSEQARTLTDEEAAEVAAIFETWASKIGFDVDTGDRLWYDTKLYKVLQAHLVQEGNTPDSMTELYLDISTPEWPEWRRPEFSSDAYNPGDKVTFEGQHYICRVMNCMLSPAEAPYQWKLADNTTEK